MYWIQNNTDEHRLRYLPPTSSLATPVEAFISCVSFSEICPPDDIIHIGWNTRYVLEYIGFERIPMNIYRMTHHQHCHWYHQSKPPYSLRHPSSFVQLVISFIPGMIYKINIRIHWIQNEILLWTQIELLTTDIITGTTG